MPGILQDSQNYLDEASMDKAQQSKETEPDGDPKVTSPTITDFFQPKPVMTSPKPAKGLLNFFKPTSSETESGTPKEGIEAQGNSPVVTVNVDENDFTKLRPADSTDTSNPAGGAQVGQKGKGKKRKQNSIGKPGIETKKRRKEKIPDNSLEDFEEPNQAPVKVNSTKNKGKSVKEKGKNVQKGQSKEKVDDLPHVEPQVPTESNSAEPEGNSKVPDTEAGSEPVKIILPDDICEEVDDSVVSISYAEFLNDVTETNEKPGGEMDSGATGTEKESAGGSRPAEDVEMLDLGAPDQVKETDDGKPEKKKPKTKNSKTKATKKCKITDKNSNDVTDGDCNVDSFRKNPKSGVEKIGQQKGAKGKKGAPSQTELCENEPKTPDVKNVSIAKFFVKKDCERPKDEHVVTADIHSLHSDSLSPAILSPEQRRLSRANVVIESSDSEAIEELGSFPITPGKPGAVSDSDCVMSANDSKSGIYSAFFFGKKSAKKEKGTEVGEIEKPVAELTKPEKNETGSCVKSSSDEGGNEKMVKECAKSEEVLINDSGSEEKFSPLKSPDKECAKSEEILIDDSGSEEKFASLKSPVVKSCPKKTTQMAFNFASGSFKMEKVSQDEADVSQTSETVSENEETENSPSDTEGEVKAKKNIAAFFTSTPKVPKGTKKMAEKKNDSVQGSSSKGAAKKVARNTPKGKKNKATLPEMPAKTGTRAVKNRVKKLKKDETPTETDKEPVHVAEGKPDPPGKSEPKETEETEGSAGPVSRRLRKRRPLNGIYKAAMVQDERSPLKIKLTRTGTKPASSSSGTEEKTPRKTRQSARTLKSKECKLSAAQYLLQKAREKKAQKASEAKSQKGKTKTPEVKLKAAGKKSAVKGKAKVTSQKGKKKSRDEEVKSKQKRRKSQDSDDSIIVIDEKTKKKAPAKKVATPRKRAGVKTPRKGTPKKKGKVAPLFMSKKDRDAVAAEEKEVEVIETPEMIEYRRVRDAIINSGISDNIKQRLKQVEETSIVMLDWPPLPGKGENHILQIPEKSDIWELPSKVLPLKDVDVQSAVSCPSFVYGFEKDLDFCRGHKMPEEFSKPDNFSSDVILGLLSEVRENTPGFPIRKMYKSLVARRQLAELEMAEGSQDAECGDTKPATIEARSKSDDSVVIVDDDEQDKAKQERKEATTKGKKKGGKRRSGRLRRSRSMDAGSKEEEKSSGDMKEKNEPADSVEKREKMSNNLVWTDVYQPRSAQDVIGNSNSVKKLKSWLTKWKERVDREARKQKMLERKEARKNKKKKGSEASSQWLTDDESDFELSDMSDDDYDDEAITNTMLLTGPHGIGKTATVYALAQELGYKVFEVNASSKRNGKLLMSQLLEATQSHHVSKANLAGGGTPSTPTRGNPFAPKSAPAEEEKPKPKAATSFFNMFNKKAEEETNKKGPDSIEVTGKKRGSRKKIEQKTPKKETPVKRGGRKRKVEEIDESTNEKSNSKGKLTKTPKGKGKPKPMEETTEVKKPAASLSLILFEDVDIIFEEDKGFIQAIQSLMSMTKRPMIMTTNDPKLAGQFEGLFEELIYRKPSEGSIASYLQLLCLAENLRTDHCDILSTVKACDGDVRRSLLLLQFWVVSGAGKEHSEKTVKFEKKKSETDQGLQNSQKSEDKESQERLKLLKNKMVDSEDEFEILPTRRRVRRVAPVIDSDSSLDSFSGTPQKPKRLKLDRKMDAIFEDSQPLSQDGESQSVEKVYVEIPGPCVHLGFFGSTIGPASFVTEEKVLLDYMKAKPKDQKDLDLQLDLLGHYKDNHRSDLITNNFRHLMPLPKQVVINPYPQVTSPQLNVPKKKFSRIKADWYDSEESSDGFKSLLTKSTENTVLNSEMGESSVPMETTNPSTSQKQDDILVYSSVKALSKFYDDCSLVDTIQQKAETLAGDCGNEFSWTHGCVIPGLEDEFVSFDPENLCRRRGLEEGRTFAVLSSLHQCRDRLNKVIEKTSIMDSKDSILERLTVPVEDDEGVVQRFSDFEDPVRFSAVKKCAEMVSHNLPVCVQGQPSAIATDYMPNVRKICKAEEIKEASKIKRRFFHYLDSISFHLKPSVIETLNNTFR